MAFPECTECTKKFWFKGVFFFLTLSLFDYLRRRVMAPNRVQRNDFPPILSVPNGCGSQLRATHDECSTNRWKPARFPPVEHSVIFLFVAYEFWLFRVAPAPQSQIPGCKGHRILFVCRSPSESSVFSALSKIVDRMGERKAGKSLSASIWVAKAAGFCLQTF